MRTFLVAASVFLFTATALAAEPVNDALEQMRAVLPSQSHAMIDVEYHFVNLWFAAHEANWPLAGFYLNESRARVQWALRIRPVRKLSTGQDFELKPMADVFDRNVEALRATIEHKDRKAFVAAYRDALAACHACHVAAEKPYLKTVVPREPASRLIHMKP